jgi:hypothetical protein
LIEINPLTSHLALEIESRECFIKIRRWVKL